MRDETGQRRNRLTVLETPTGRITVAPLAVDPDIGFIDVPRSMARPEMAAHALFELRRKALDPAVHGRVIELNPSVGERALELAVADSELQVSAHHPQE